MAAPLAAQELKPYTPSESVQGKLTTELVGAPFPMILIDEAVLPPLWLKPYPLAPWNEAQLCLAAMGVPMKNAGSPPPVAVVPWAKTFRVRDLAVDSLVASIDPKAVTGAFGPPTVGYTLYHSNVVLVTEKFRDNIVTLRHEAIHMILWRTTKLWGHLENTQKYFDKCDLHYGEGK